MKLRPQGKAAMLTGGNKGIGLETVRLLAEEAVKVLVCSRREDALAECRADVEKTTGVTLPIDGGFLGR